MTGTFIDTWKAPFTTEDRILISEGDVFAGQVADFDALLTSHGVEHTLLTQTSDAHNWAGGWLPDAIAGLYGLETDLHQPSVVLNGSSGGQTLTASAVAPRRSLAGRTISSMAAAPPIHSCSSRTSA